MSVIRNMNVLLETLGKPTPAQTKKLLALSVVAEEHGDDKTVELVRLALAGDRNAAKRLGVAIKDAKAVANATGSKAPLSGKRSAPGGPHPWAHDEE